jgi:hypothetical protein
MARHGGKNDHTGAVPLFEDRVDDLLHRLRLDGEAAARAVGLADAGVEEPEVIGDLGDGPDGGPGALADGLLIDRDGW